jgi:multimeric flavodoxin WrbA
LNQYKEVAHMKALVINASPNMDKGNTAVILGPFIDGMKEAGAEIELFYTKKLRIQPCQGEMNCMLKTPGVCFQHDDMDWLRPKWKEAEFIVVATPLFVDGMPGPLKNFFDRIFPIVTLMLEVRDGHTRHLVREGVKPGPVVLVSSCGAWEMDVFDPLLAHMKALSINSNRSFIGAVLRPHAVAFRRMLESGAPVKDVLEAAMEAGRQLVTTGEMSGETLATVSRPLLPRDTFVQMMNQYFGQVLEELATNQNSGITD